MRIQRKTCRAPDGVTLVYSVCGAGEPALFFIHGGLANRTFWDAQRRRLDRAPNPSVPTAPLP